MQNFNKKIEKNQKRIERKVQEKKNAKLNKNFIRN